MKLTFDPEANAAYLQLRERAGDLETVVVTDELNVDLLPDGTVYGIEFLNAKQQFGEGVDAKLTFKNLVSGQEKTLKVA
jgi:uncharacterized protein YuzE